MSQVLDQDSTLETSDTMSHGLPADRPPVGELNEFSYRPVPVIAVVGTTMAVMSSAALFIWLVLPLCLVALTVSLVALWSIRSSRGAYGGTPLAFTGVTLSLLFFAGGIGYQIYAYQTEVPPGYQRVSFVDDISEKGFVEENQQLQVHPDVKALEGEKVFLKGYIYPTGQDKGLRAFLLLKDNGQCCFGGQPELTDRLGVKMMEGKEIDYYSGKVSVAGTFRLNDRFTGQGKLEPIFILEAEHFAKAKSDF